MFRGKTLLVLMLFVLIISARYCIGADYAVAIGNDYTVSSVVDTKLSQMESKLRKLMFRLEEMQREQFTIMQEMKEQIGEIDRMRNPLYYGQTDYNIVERVNYETCGEDRFNRTIPVPEEMTEKLIIDGDFEDAFNGWEVGHGWDFSNSVWNCQLVYDEEKGSNVVQFERSQSGSDGSSVGITQDVFIDLAKYDDVKIKLDVKPMYQGLTGSGGVGGEYPVMVQVAFIDQRDEPHVWTYGFYYDGDSFYDSSKKVGQDTWFTYTSPNLKEVLPDCADESRTYDKSAWQLMTHEYKKPVIPKYITRVLVFGSGWDYRGRADNVEFVLTPKGDE